MTAPICVTGFFAFPFDVSNTLGLRPKLSQTKMLTIIRCCNKRSYIPSAAAAALCRGLQLYCKINNETPYPVITVYQGNQPETMRKLLLQLFIRNTSKRRGRKERSNTADKNTTRPDLCCKRYRRHSIKYVTGVCAGYFFVSSFIYGLLQAPEVAYVLVSYSVLLGLSTDIFL